MNKFTLLNKNIKVLDFDYDLEEHMIVNIERNYKDGEKYAPFGLIKNDKIDRNEFNRWWKNRQIPASRNGLKELLYRSNIYDKESFDLLEYKCYCLSLSDQYWVKLKDDDVKWEEVNFFDNTFSEVVGMILFNGGKTSSLLNLNTPDMTSNGNYEKRWKIINNERYLVKGGSKIINQEVFNEVIATKLYERLLEKDEFVSYELVKEGYREVTICKNFITKDTELVPAWKINEYFDYIDNENSYEHYKRCLNEIGIKNNTLVDKMIVCDYILANKDRHCNNFGVIRNVETLEFTNIAPIYDNGCSLWYDENDIYVGEFFLTKPFDEYESNQIKLVKDLSFFEEEKLEGFTNEVKEILLSNKLLSKERVDKIVSEIDKRIKYVSELKFM